MSEQRIARNRRIFSIFAWLSIVLIAVAGFKGHRFSYLLILQIIVGLSGMSELSHYDEAGRAHMVDVSAKAATRREAVAEAFVELSMLC
jgi:hypothetical protein